MAKIWRAAYYSTTTRGPVIVNTFHFKSDETDPLGPAPSAGTVVDALDGLLTTKYRALSWTGQKVETLTVTEELADSDSSIPEQAIKTIGLNGTHAPSQDELPLGETILLSSRSNAPVRGGTGRIWLPPNMDPSLLNNGLWDTTSTWFTTTIKAFTDALLAGVDYGDPLLGGHLSYVIYSRTRRNRGDADWYFDVEAIIPRAVPHWLRSRQTSP